MKILVLGATGQIGHALLKALAATEHDISTVVRSTADQQFPDTVSVMKHGAFTPDVFRAALEGVDHVVYGIGLPEQFLFDNRVFDEINCTLLGDFLEALRNSSVRQLTYLSTYEVFEVVDNQINETHPIADESEMTPYFQSMVRAYRMVIAFARESGIALTTIHPAAVYGGRNTGNGITDYMENLASRNWPRLPFINPSSFPVVHVHSLTDAIVKALDKPGSYIVSDEMTSLKDIAHAMRKQVWSYVPLVLPLWMTMIGIHILEAFARLTRTKPFASSVQIAFLTKGWRPQAGKAQAELGWTPMPLDEGVKRFLAERRDRHADALNDAGSAAPVTGAARIKLIAGLELLTAAGLFLYWIMYFTVGLAPEDPPAGYFVFQRTFTYADLILAGLLVRTASLLLGADPNRRILGRGLSLICAGALFFLGGLDISFNFQNDIYTVFSIDMALEVAINIWCILFGFILAYEFSFDAYQRY